MNWEEFKQAYLTDEEREELARKKIKFSEEVKRRPWKYIHRPKRHLFPTNPVIKKDDEWRDETCWDELRKSLD